jgi:Zn-dependent protease
MENQELSLPPQPAPLTVGAAPVVSEHPPAGHDPFGGPSHEESLFSRIRRRLGAIVAGAVALIAKFFAAIKGLLLLIPKLKLLTTSGTALISVLAYSLFFGWWFAVGFVALIFVHEMGHVYQLRREGVPASAPMFIPFLGAAVMMKAMPKDALSEARVGLAGPVLGTVGAAVCFAIAEATNSDFFRALAYIGFLINLFNLLPVVPLDGGRAMAAMAPWMWFVGFGVMVVLDLLIPSFILIIVTVLAAFELYRRWEQRKTGSPQQRAYYNVSPRNRLLVGAVYIGLIAVLALGMDASHILNTGSHSFRSI